MANRCVHRIKSDKFSTCKLACDVSRKSPCFPLAAVRWSSYKPRTAKRGEARHGRAAKITARTGSRVGNGRLLGAFHPRHQAPRDLNLPLLPPLGARTC